MFDVLMAFIMGAVMYATVYYYDVVGAYRFQTGKRQRKTGENRIKIVLA